MKIKDLACFLIVPNFSHIQYVDAACSFMVAESGLLDEFAVSKKFLFLKVSSGKEKDVCIGSRFYNASKIQR